MSLQQLREDRSRLAAAYNEFVEDTSKPFDEARQAKASEMLQQVKNVEAQIAAIQSKLTIDVGNIVEAGARAESNERGRSVDENASRIKGALRALGKAFAGQRLTEDEAALVDGSHPKNIRMVQNVAEGTGATGGVLVPTIVMPTVLAFLKTYGNVRSVASVVETAGGMPLSYPTVDYTNLEGEMVAENQAATPGDVNTFASATIGAFKFSSTIIPVSLEILQDAVFSPETIVLQALTMAISRGQNRKFTTGTGTNEPKGVVTSATLGYTAPAGNTTSIAYDYLKALFHSVDPAYRQNGSWMFNDTTWKTISSLKDANGRPLILPSVEGAYSGDGDVDGYTIFRRPCSLNQHMASPAPNAKTILFGDFKRYMIRDVMGLVVLRFTDSAYAGKGQVGFLGWARADGRLIDAPNSQTGNIESLRYFEQSAA